MVAALDVAWCEKPLDAFDEFSILHYQPSEQGVPRRGIELDEQCSSAPNRGLSSPPVVIGTLGAIRSLSRKESTAEPVDSTEKFSSMSSVEAALTAVPEFW